MIACSVWFNSASRRLSGSTTKHLKPQKMKTPMQEVFAHLRASKRNDNFGEVYCVDWLLENEKSYLEKEKEVIKNAYMAGESDATHKMDSSLNYYNETFNKTK